MSSILLLYQIFMHIRRHNTRALINIVANKAKNEGGKKALYLSPMNLIEWELQFGLLQYYYMAGY